MEVKTLIKYDMKVNTLVTFDLSKRGVNGS